MPAQQVGSRSKGFFRRHAKPIAFAGALAALGAAELGVNQRNVMNRVVRERAPIFAAQRVEDAASWARLHTKYFRPNKSVVISPLRVEAMNEVSSLARGTVHHGPRGSQASPAELARVLETIRLNEKGVARDGVKDYLRDLRDRAKNMPHLDGGKQLRNIAEILEGFYELPPQKREAILTLSKEVRTYL